MGTERLEVAQRRFGAFFAELRSTFLERDDLLTQISLALLGREHVLVTGPPGTAKSSLASAVVRRIVDEQSGRASVFSKQVTESTVQTDLIGPINFKALTESGRTEHFTDEGLLGAIHAHLDEVLDGRDMLLRATLSLLHERELKEGTKVTPGLIECAIMTSNRYLAEVLETSRENLLAFIDRIAFLAYVPKGFANPDHLTRVLAAQTGGARPAPLEALLTIQDLDELQAAADRVVIPEEILAHLGAFLARFEEEVEAALRADPTFAPTRYLSTRTAVRLAKLLKAACVLSRCIDRQDRALVVDASDFAFVRFGLLLSGPRPDEIDALLKKERDARERRQLAILQVEREIFDRLASRMRPPAASMAPPRRVDVRGLGDEVRSATRSEDPVLLEQTAKKLAGVASSSLPGAEEAAALLREAADEIVRRAVRTGIGAGIGEGTGAAQSLRDSARSIASLADEVEAVDSTRRPLGTWLRGRAIDLLAKEALALGSRALAQALRGDAHAIGQAHARADALIDELIALLEERDRLRARGADSTDATAWDRALDELTQEIAELFDAALASELGAVLADRAELERTLGSLRPLVDALTAVDERLSKLGQRSAAKPRVLGPRLWPTLAAAFDRLDASDRERSVEQAKSLIEMLESQGLEGAIDAAVILEGAAQAFLRSEPTFDALVPATLKGYRALREAEQRLPIGVCLIEIAARLRMSELGRDPEQAMRQVLRGMPAGIVERCAAADAARVERALELLARWGTTIAGDRDVPRVGLAR
ncbi:MAG: MoxR family ATPase, partial [Sandaracinaceae bacterium]|nr:MoxR family ATPase [Sandaracinaceae bacterium]